MKTQVIIPPPSVARYVNSLLVIEDGHQQRDFTLPLFANGSPTLVFQTTRAKKEQQSIGHLTLYGQTLRPSELIIKEGFTLIACFFHAHTAGLLFELEGKELTDAHLDLNLLKAVRRERCQEQLLNASSLEQRLHILYRLILSLAGAAPAPNARLLFAAEQIRNSKGFYTLSHIQQELNITERTLQRLFESAIGLSPKLYGKVCQFHASFQQVNQRHFSNLSDVAYDFGYADQSHFSRVFKEFTNSSPKDYLKRIAGIDPQPL